MTRFFGFLQNVTTSKKQQQLELSNATTRDSENKLFRGSKSSKSGSKSKSKSDIQIENNVINNVNPAVNETTKKKTLFNSVRKSRSVNSGSLDLRSASPSNDSKQKDSVSIDQPNNLPASVENYDSTSERNANAKQSFDGKQTKRRSLRDVMTLQGNFTQSSIKHDSSKKTESDCSSAKSIVSNTNMLSILKIPPSMNSHTEMAVPTTYDTLHPTSNSTINLSTSSLNSSSAKTIASKSNDETFTDKKRKTSNSSRQKKFHRHFQQVDANEEVLNYFSCAFVSDILLQGYMYITNNHIAFYSNVFGYVTKILIPITSVARISKEKTVKIIPNAIAVATIDEQRHVFSSFLSREAAYQLMISVWKEALPLCEIDVTTSAAQLKISSEPSDTFLTNTIDTVSKSKLGNDESELEKLSPTCSLQGQQLVATSNTGVSEIENNAAISGNENLSMPTDEMNHDDHSPQNGNSNENSKRNTLNGDLLANRDANSKKDASNIVRTIDKLKSALSELSSIKRFKLKIPRTIHIAYFGVSLVIILALLAAFLVYHIAEIKHSRLGPFSVNDLNQGVSDVKLYAGILKWQKDMQTQRIHLTKNILANNLEQISQISDSLQTLSSLIHLKDNIHNNLNDKISKVIGEYNNLEACVLKEKLEQP